MKKVHIHYFTGTGNTKFVVDELSKAFRKLKWKPVISNMEQTIEPEFAKDALHLFLFPVLGFSVPDTAVKYIRSLPMLENAHAAIVFTAGGYAGYAHVQAEKELVRKGFTVRFNSLLECPDNWTQMTNPMPLEKAKPLLKEVERQIPSLAKKILSSEHSKPELRNLKGFLSFLVNLGFSKLGRFMLGMAFVADQRCNACGLCVRTCPSKNISFKKIFSKRLYWGWNCVGCNRCINTCPKEAIQASWLILALHGSFQIMVVIELVKFFFLANPGMGFLVGTFALSLNILGFVFALAVVIVFELTVFNGIVFFLHQIPAIRSLSAFSWTRSFRRYVAPGFKPALSALRPSQGKR